MDSPAEIRNCEFRVECPKLWTELRETKDVNVRFCNAVECPVHYCRTPAELQRAIIKNYCVAVELQTECRSTPRVLLGDAIHYYRYTSMSV